jgi:hypothetical protein
MPYGQASRAGLLPILVRGQSGVLLPQSVLYLPLITRTSRRSKEEMHHGYRASTRDSGVYKGGV